MSDRFVPLTDYLRVSVAAEPAVSPAPVRQEDVPSSVDEADAQRFEAIAEARRFRAALADALDVAVAAILEDLAANVLARELRIEPVAVRAIVADAVQRCGELPLRVRANPYEAASLEGLDIPVVADDALRSGDVVLELRSGTIDATLGVRLARVLAAATA